jgi:molybdopterin converting factor subunit 1
MINITVKFFASLRELANETEIQMELADNSDTSQLISKVVEKFPSLKEELPTISVALNLKYIVEPVVLNHKDVVALFPPISGG